METKYHIVKRRMNIIKLSAAAQEKKPTVLSLILSFLKSLFHKKQYKRNIYAEHLERNN